MGKTFQMFFSGLLFCFMTYVTNEPIYLDKNKQNKKNYKDELFNGCL